jgi:hypothetical protein
MLIANDLWRRKVAATDHDCVFSDAGAKAGCGEIFKFYERSQEVVENKGPDFLKAKMSMKINGLPA